MLFHLTYISFVMGEYFLIFWKIWYKSQPILIKCILIKKKVCRWVFSRFLLHAPVKPDPITPPPGIHVSLKSTKTSPNSASGMKSDPSARRKSDIYPGKYIHKYLKWWPKTWLFLRENTHNPGVGGAHPYPQPQGSCPVVTIVKQWNFNISSIWPALEQVVHTLRLWPNILLPKSDLLKVIGS